MPRLTLLHLAPALWVAGTVSVSAADLPSRKGFTSPPRTGTEAAVKLGIEQQVVPGLSIFAEGAAAFAAARGFKWGIVNYGGLFEFGIPIYAQRSADRLGARGGFRLSF